MSRQVTGRTGLLCLLGSLVHFLTDQYTGTRTNGCSDSCTDGSTFFPYRPVLRPEHPAQHLRHRR